MRARRSIALAGLGVCSTLGLFAACKDQGPAGAPPGRKPPTPPGATTPGSGSGSVAPTGPCPTGVAHGPLTWIEDDYAGALACARSRHQPLMIDLWAPWCHTCLSMKTTVLDDPSLAPLASRFVFLALDTDRPTNAVATAKFPQINWPTFLVVEPEHETVQGRWLGAASISQLRGFLKDGEAAALAALSGQGLDPLLLQVRTADQAFMAKDFAGADRAYGEALAAAPAEWPRRSDVLVSQIAARAKHGDVAGCLDLALASASATGNTANATDFLVWALDCASDDKAAKAKAKAVRELAVTRLSALVDDATAPLSIDDRSDAMLNWREALVGLGKADDARAIATRQLDFLADAAGRAPDAWTRMTYNWPRAEVHDFLKRHRELVPVLEQSAADLPREYDPPARLAWLLFHAGDPAAAQPWVQKAALLVYGPRKVRVQTLAVDIAKALGKPAMERAARTALIETLRHLEPGQAQPELLAKAEAELAAMPPAGPPGLTRDPAPPTAPPAAPAPTPPAKATAPR